MIVLLNVVYIVFVFFLLIVFYQGFDRLWKYIQKKQDFYNKKKQEKEDYHAGVFPAFEELPQCLLTLELEKYPANEEELRKQYRKLSKKYHPDMGGSEERFQEINMAYQEAKKLIKKRG